MLTVLAQRPPPTAAPRSNLSSTPGPSAPPPHAGQHKGSDASVLNAANPKRVAEALPTSTASASKTKKDLGSGNGKAKKLDLSPAMGEEEALNDIVVSGSSGPKSAEPSKSAKKKKRRMEKEEGLVDAQIAEPTPKKKTKVKTSQAEAGDAVQASAAAMAPSTTAPPTPRASLTPKAAVTPLPDPPHGPVSNRPQDVPAPSTSTHPVAASSESTSDPLTQLTRLTQLEVSLDKKFTEIDRWMSIQQQYPSRTNVVKKQIERMQAEIFDLQEEIEQVRRGG